jgi:multiple sugar transport system permease protein
MIQERLVSTRRRLAPPESLGKMVLHIALSAGAFTCLVPFIWMLSTSFKEPGRVLMFPPQWIPEPFTWANYERIFVGYPFARYIVNSVVVTGTVTISQVISCSLAAYAFGRMEFPGRDKLFLAYLGTMMVPGQVTMVPTFILMKYLGLVDKLAALIVPAVFGSAFGTFLLRQFFMTIPRELEDAATLDGCNHFGIYRHVILPLSGPAIATLTVFVFMGSWNDFFWPLILINSDENRTLTLGLARIAYRGHGYSDPAVVMAGAGLSLLPILLVFFLAQRYFVQGVTLTGLKG